MCSVAKFFYVTGHEAINRFDRGGLNFLLLPWYVRCAIEETRVGDIFFLRCCAVRGGSLSFLVLHSANTITIIKKLSSTRSNLSILLLKSIAVLGFVDYLVHSSRLKLAY